MFGSLFDWSCVHSATDIFMLVLARRPLINGSESEND